MANGTIEERLSALETEVERIKERLGDEAPTERTEPSWLDQIFGTFADDPLFEEAVRLGAEWRNADRPASDEDDLP